MDILIGTSNESKITYIKNLLGENSFTLKSLSDLGIDTIANESGITVLENAKAKAKYYFDLSKTLTISIDSGLEFENIEEKLQPRDKVKRICGVDNPTEEEMLIYYCKFIREHGGRLKGTWYNVFVIYNGKEFYTHTANEDYYFVDKPNDIRINGLPLNSIQIDIKSGKYKSEKKIQTYPFDQEINQFITNTLKEII